MKVVERYALKAYENVGIEYLETIPFKQLLSKLETIYNQVEYRKRCGEEKVNYNDEVYKYFIADFMDKTEGEYLDEWARKRLDKPAYIKTWIEHCFKEIYGCYPAKFAEEYEW